MNDKLKPSDPKGLLSAAESARQFLAKCQDRSVYSNAVHHYTQLSAAGQHRPDINLDPAKANLARIIDLSAISRVLLVDWHESVLPRFLAEQGIQVVVYPADEELAIWWKPTARGSRRLRLWIMPTPPRPRLTWMV